MRSSKKKRAINVSVREGKQKKLVSRKKNRESYVGVRKKKGNELATKAKRTVKKKEVAYEKKLAQKPSDQLEGDTTKQDAEEQERFIRKAERGEERYNKRRRANPETGEGGEKGRDRKVARRGREEEAGRGGKTQKRRE